MPVSPTSGRRRGTLASGKIAHHTYSVKGDPQRAVVTLESESDLDLLVNRDGTKPYPGKADLSARTTSGSEKVAVEEFGDELGVGVVANEAGDYQLAMSIEGSDRDGDRDDGSHDGDGDGDEGSGGDGDDGSDGEERESGEYPTVPDEVNKLSIKSRTQERTSYTVDVDGEIEFLKTDVIVSTDFESSESGRSTDGVTLPETVNGSSKATGILRKDTHVFAFTGELLDYDLQGPGRMSINNEIVEVRE